MLKDHQIYDHVNDQKKIDLLKALKMRLVNKMSFREIGSHFNCSGAAVYQRLKRFSSIVQDPALNEAYNQNKISILAGIERILVQEIVNTDKLKVASVNNLAYALRQINDIMTREKGKSLQGNMAISHELSPALQSVIDGIAEARRQSLDQQEVIDILVAFLQQTFPEMTPSQIQTTVSFLCDASGRAEWVPIMRSGGQTMVDWLRGDSKAPLRLFKVVHYDIDL
jgi:predicted DNA-binding protein YlxM (UPF0122 family)